VPRYSDEEREAIKEALPIEGERLFSLYGLKKLVVDDIAEAINISKGSFYNFYSNKEHLFIVIVFRVQERIFMQVHKQLKQKSLSPKETVREAIWSLLNSVNENPILKNIDSATMNVLQRKLPKEIFETHAMDDADFWGSLKQYGVYFKQPLVLIAKSAQILFGISRDFYSDADYKRLIDIYIEGLLLQVEESN
jgi:AcrR family transcriptional regulator